MVVALGSACWVLRVKCFLWNGHSSLLINHTPHKVWSTSNFCHSIFSETVNISCICRVAFVWTKSQCKSQSSSKALPCVEAGGPKCISRSCLSTKNCVLVWNFPMYICEYSQFSYCFIFFQVPSYISRSVAGSYDNEAVAIFALIFTFYLYLKVRFC